MNSKETALEHLAPYKEALRECIEAGFNAWRELGRLAMQLRIPLDARARASFIFCHIVFVVRQRFSDVPGVRLMEKRGFPELVIKGRFVIRFKKLDKKGRARNASTKQTRLWYGQFDLPDMPPEAVKLVAGYVLDLLGTEIERVLVICPVSTSAVEWMVDLGEPGAATIVEMPRRPKKPKSPPVRSTKREKSEEDPGPKE